MKGTTYEAPHYVFFTRILLRCFFSASSEIKHKQMLYMFYIVSLTEYETSSERIMIDSFLEKEWKREREHAIS